MENQDNQRNGYHISGARELGGYMSNLEIREFSQTITNFVEGSDLQEEVKRMALQEILLKQEQKARDALLAEIAARDAAEKEEVKEDAESV